jgi:hypothetical protein
MMAVVVEAVVVNDGNELEGLVDILYYYYIYAKQKTGISDYNIIRLPSR